MASSCENNLLIGQPPEKGAVSWVVTVCRAGKSSWPSQVRAGRCSASTRMNRGRGVVAVVAAGVVTRSSKRRFSSTRRVSVPCGGRRRPRHMRRSPSSFLRPSVGTSSSPMVVAVLLSQAPFVGLSSLRQTTATKSTTSTALSVRGCVATP